ncbi:PREDICTED: nose resistant to fluoxetine protein 6-like [Papilio xuthus]|uniref:Nose resistant to fluoxetine protein 6-like n=1 Tax=Papilio xuthus TaxID=66420 RepID=A0AAJ7EBG5_PAPXU|nr:PREDICTED: nose resistant to fluoxetine protein 6-like [Papilio xuthus]
MKNIYLFVTFAIVSVNSYVTKNTNSTKSPKVTSSHYKINEKKYESLKTFTEEERGVYLDDVLFALKSHNWTSEEIPCLNQTLQMLQNLQNFTLWAVWQWDSISSEPQGLLFGNGFHLGNFDQCMDAPWHNNYPDLRTQYCLADIVLERSDRAPRKRSKDLANPYQSALDIIEHRSLFMRPLNHLSWGLCVPRSCQRQSVQRLFGILLAHSHLGAAGLRARISVPDPCQSGDKPRQYDTLFYSFITFTILFTGLILLCTYIRQRTKDSDNNSMKNQVLKALCLRNNYADILKVNKSGLDVFYGIRFLSMCLITMDHQFGIANGGPISNGAQVDEDAVSFTGLLVLHNDLFVDTFFLLSGFLSANTLSTFKKMPNLFILILKRYVRLTVAFAYIIFFVCSVYPFTGSGPLWSRAIALETDQCRKNWWLSLLMLNNYIDSENICIVVSWYIPCDFHFFVVTLLLYWLYRTQPKMGVVSAVVVSIGALVSPALVNYYNNLPPIQLFTYDFLSSPRSQRQFQLTYIKSHTRYAAYLVGFFSGLYFAHCKAIGNIKRISRKYSVLGACISLVVMFGLMLYGATYVWRSYELVAGTVYATLERPLFASSIALLVLCCSMGHVPLIKGFLSWYPWAPLSRLSYGLYLTHSSIIARNVFSARGSQRADTFLFLIQTGGVIIMGSIAALYILLIFELPINNLLNLCFIKRKKTSENNHTIRDVESEKGNDNRGFIREHRRSLPSPASVISKF